MADCRFLIFLSFFLISEEVNEKDGPDELLEYVGDGSEPELLTLVDRTRLLL